jgi:hypothetical protein
MRLYLDIPGQLGEMERPTLFFRDLDVRLADRDAQIWQQPDE